MKRGMNMKTLETIQKTCKVLHTLTKIAMTYTTDPADYVQMELTPLAQWTQ